MVQGGNQLVDIIYRRCRYEWRAGDGDVDFIVPFPKYCMVYARSPDAISRDLLNLLIGLDQDDVKAIIFDSNSFGDDSPTEPIDGGFSRLELLRGELHDRLVQVAFVAVEDNFRKVSVRHAMEIKLLRFGSEKIS